MRLVKMSPDDDDFGSEQKLQDYFRSVLWERGGEFYFPSATIAENGLMPGELLLFQYDGKLRFIAESASGRLNNPDKKFASDEFNAYLFKVNLETLCETKPVTIEELGNLLREQIGYTKHLHAQGWNQIPDSPASEGLIRSFVKSPVLNPRETPAR